ncbi:hypothetical protein TUMSATVNIG3_41880 [Vibrio nigripulchritudo]|nr:hypothetical protein TUMSATVNIG2_41370 [Vibrio nigripulchritudo]BDU45390.1 hypothetical protein TUMSATVNIG3_41880 [Vibrio nigripulchritudo]
MKLNRLNVATVKEDVMAWKSTSNVCRIPKKTRRFCEKVGNFDYHG